MGFVVFASNNESFAKMPFGIRYYLLCRLNASEQTAGESATWHTLRATAIGAQFVTARVALIKNVSLAESPGHSQSRPTKHTTNKKNRAVARLFV